MIVADLTNNLELNQNVEKKLWTLSAPKSKCKKESGEKSVS